MLRAEVALDGTFEVAKSLSDFIGRLIWLPGTVHSKFINCFLFLIVLFFISKMDFEVEVAVEAFDCLVNIALENGLLGDGDQL